MELRPTTGSLDGTIETRSSVADLLRLPDVRVAGRDCYFRSSDFVVFRSTFDADRQRDKYCPATDASKKASPASCTSPSISNRGSTALATAKLTKMRLEYWTSVERLENFLTEGTMSIHQ